METRKHEISVEMDATAEQVWKAVTEGEELIKWLAPEVRVTPGLNGTVCLSWGAGMSAEVPIRIWEPGKRFGWVEREGSERPRRVEFVIEASGGRTRLTLVHSGFGTEASFDDEYDSVFGGWHTFLAMLRQGVERFPGAPGANLCVMHPLAAALDDAWARLIGPDGLALSTIAEGGGYRARMDDMELAGSVVRNVKPGYLCLSVENRHPATLGLFVEKCGGTLLTIEWIQYHPQSGEADDITARIRAFAGRVFPAAS